MNKKKWLKNAVWVSFLCMMSSCSLFPLSPGTERGNIEYAVTAADNVMRIVPESDCVAYPLQFARPFLKGEISAYPRVIVNGVPVETQADVKQRHSDGSVKHAVISVILKDLDAYSPIELRFDNQSDGGQGKAPPVARLLSDFDFDAVIEFSGGAAGRASARAMLEAGHYVQWTKGAVATTLLLADHSASRTYDCGTDGNRSLRPAFHVTFWPTLGKYRVRYVVEACNTEALQDQAYSVALTAGRASPAAVYGKADVRHIAGSRWTKRYWNDGSEYPPASIDHNVRYLAATRMIPNFDPSKRVSDAVAAASHSSWRSKPRDIYDPGFWTKAVNAPGGRPDFGLYPTWTVRWLFNGDSRFAEIALAQGELCGAWPVHFREGDPRRYLDRGRTVAGIGHAASISSRPSIWFSNLAHRDVRPEDALSIVGPRTLDDWYAPDNEHMIDPASAQYLLTGDYWYLEETYFFAAYSAGAYTPNRGPTGAEGGLFYGAERAHGRTLRTRVHAASVAPDDHPEKAYFGTLVSDALAIWEGIYGVRGGEYENTALWQWGRDYAPRHFVDPAFGNLGVPALGFWIKGYDKYVTSPAFASMARPGASAYSLQPWGANMVICALGRAEELGFRAGPMKRWIGAWFTRQFTDPAYEPFLIASLFQPTVSASGEWYASLADVKAAYTAEFVAGAERQFREFGNDTEHGYTNIALAAASFLTDIEGGDAAWNFMERNALGNPLLDDNPKWALLPRR